MLIWALIATILALWGAVGTFGYRMLYLQMKRFNEETHQALRYYIIHDELPEGHGD